MNSKIANNPPYIVKFTTDKAKYIYDINTNRVFCVNDIVYRIVEYYHVISNNDIIGKFRDIYEKEDIINGINKMEKMEKEIGVFKPRMLNEFKMVIDEKEYEYNLSHQVGNLTLVVSENCNLRCSYCLYDFNNNPCRSHCKKMMTWNVAKSAIDFVSTCCGDVPEHYGIGFYGGEPFLNFKLMQKSLKYFREKTKHVKNKKLIVTLTTNGTLLDKEKIEWLINNDVSLLISLDGPELVHDRYRKFINGKPTHSKVLSGFEEIKSRDEKYFRNNVSINAVIHPPYEFEMIFEYFIELNVKLNLNFVNEMNTKEFLNKFSNKEYGPFYQKLYNRYKEKITKNIYLKNNETFIEDRILSELFGKRFYNIVNRMITSPSEYIYISPCKIGLGKLSVNPDGKFYPCANVNDKLDEYCIGDIYNGFYKVDGRLKTFRKMQDFVKLLNIQCYKCWASKICQKMCFVHILPTLSETFEEWERSCNLRRNGILEAMKDYFRIEEINPDSYKSFLLPTQ